MASKQPLIFDILSFNAWAGLRPTRWRTFDASKQSLKRKLSGRCVRVGKAHRHPAQLHSPKVVRLPIRICCLETIKEADWCRDFMKAASVFL